MNKHYVPLIDKPGSSEAGEIDKIQIGNRRIRPKPRKLHSQEAPIDD